MGDYKGTIPRYGANTGGWVTMTGYFQTESLTRRAAGGVMCVAPLLIYDTMSISEGWLNIHETGGFGAISSDSKARGVIYADNNGYPGSLAIQSGEEFTGHLSGPRAGKVKPMVGVLTKGLYWIGAYCNYEAPSNRGYIVSYSVGHMRWPFTPQGSQGWEVSGLGVQSSTDANAGYQGPTAPPTFPSGGARNAQIWKLVIH